MLVSRRGVLKAAIVGTGAVAGAVVIGPRAKEFATDLTNSPDAKPSRQELSEVQMGEYAAIWNMRPAVLISNFIACKRLDGMMFPKGVGASLADILGLFDGNYLGFDFNEQTSEYVGDLHLSTSRPLVSVIEAGGLSFTATMVGRAGLSSPVDFTEFHTHTNIPSSGLLRDYFEDNRIIAPSSIQQQLTKLGTDATIFVAEDNLWDLKFVPLEDLVLGYRLQVLRENGVYETLTAKDAESSDSLLDWLTNSATKLSSVQVRAIMAFQPLCPASPYSVTIENTVKGDIPGFRRELNHNGQTFIDEFYAHYDTAGNFVG